MAEKSLCSMHIGFLTPEYPHDRVNYSAGIGTSLKNLIDSLLKINCRVSVFVYNENCYDYIEEGGLTIHLIQQAKPGNASWYTNRKRINKYVQYYIHTEKIDLIEAPDWTGITSFMSFTCPVAIRLHGSDGFFCYTENRPQKLKNYFFEKLALQQADAVISPNAFTQRITQKVFKISSFKQVETINLGLNLANFGDFDFAEIEENSVYYLGTIIRKKGVFNLPAIFGEISKAEPKSKFYLIGNDAPDVFSGEESTWKLLKKEISPEILRHVTYLGKIEYKEVAEYLKRANVCVFPSMAETTGMVTLEAMAMGRPVIASNEDWSKELIDDGMNGYRINPLDYQRFAKTACGIFNDRSKAISLGQNARAKVEKEFDATSTARKNLDFYKTIVKR